MNFKKDGLIKILIYDFFDKILKNEVSHFVIFFKN